MQPPNDPIPLDVLSEILNHVDYRTLQTCAFLSASILPLCHDRLFREIDLAYVVKIRSYLRLYAILHQRPKISLYVRSLQIRIGDIHDYLGFPCDDPILFNTFSAVTNLKHLVINISALEAGQWHSHATVVQLFNLLSLPGVTSVTFSGWHKGTQSPHIPISLIEVPVSLRNLTLERLELWGCLNTNFEGRPKGKLIIPSSISIIGCDNLILKQLFQLSKDPNSSLDLSSLKKVTVSPESSLSYDNTIIEDFFHHVFYSLEHFSWEIGYRSDTNTGGLEHVDSRHLIHLRELSIRASVNHHTMMKDLASALSVFIGNIPETTPFEMLSLHFVLNYRPWNHEEGLKDWALDEWKELSRMLSVPRMEYVKKHVEIDYPCRDRNSVVEFEGKVRDLFSIEGRLSDHITLNISANPLFSDSRSFIATSPYQQTENGSMEGHTQMESESVLEEQSTVKWSVTKRLKRFFLSSSPFRKRAAR